MSSLRLLLLGVLKSGLDWEPDIILLVFLFSKVSLKSFSFFLLFSLFSAFFPVLTLFSLGEGPLSELFFSAVSLRSSFLLLFFFFFFLLFLPLSERLLVSSGLFTSSAAALCCSWTFLGTYGSISGFFFPLAAFDFFSSWRPRPRPPDKVSAFPPPPPPPGARPCPPSWARAPQSALLGLLPSSDPAGRPVNAPGL